LGQFGVMIANKLGNIVTAISRGDNKKEMALKLGAKYFINSKDSDQLKAAANSCDIILDTVGVKHDINSLLNILDKNGTLVLIGAGD